MKSSAREYGPKVRQSHSLDAFASLNWYEAVIKFVFTFTAKTSEMLLAAGLIASTANFLTDGSVMGNNPPLTSAWAWAQALAIDSSLGVTCYYLFINIKRRDWIKVFCYGLLTILLAVVAGTITNVDTLSHAIHTTITGAMTQVGLDIKTLTTLRAIAVVGFLLMSRLKEVSFKDLYASSPAEQSHTLPASHVSGSPEGEKTAEQIKEFIAEAIAPFMTALAQQKRAVIIEEQETLPLPTLPAASEQQIDASLVQKAQEDTAREDAQILLTGGSSTEEREAKLAHAYQELQTEGERISGRTLAARAHVRRTTCNQWLAVHHPEIAQDGPEEEP